MPRIADVVTVTPENGLDQVVAKKYVYAHFDGKLRALDRLITVFDNAGIDRRYFVESAEWLRSPHTVTERNEAYIRHATSLATTATEKVLDQNSLTVDGIDYLIFVNTTGIATPSIDARVINALGMRRDIRRTPVWGLGCAGGVSGLSHAYHHLLGHPKERVLVISLELCGLTFLAEDFSPSNLVATALFADGCGAALMVGDEVSASGAEVLGSQSTFYPDSLDVMGWNVVETGLQVVFAQRIPEIVQEHSREDIESFLDKHEVTVDDLSGFVFHPGGAKVLAAYEEALSLDDDALALSRKVLRERGNMSSATVLYVLEEYLDQQDNGAGEYGLVQALGPGFSSESLLIRN